MRLLVVSNLYPPAVLGGYELLCEQVVGELIARGHAVDVLCSDQRVEGQAHASRTGRFGEAVMRDLKLRLPFGKAPKRARLAHLICERRNRFTTRACVSKGAYDLVFFWSQRRLSMGPLRAVQALGAPMAVTLNDDWLLSYAAPPLSLNPRKLASFGLDRSLFKPTTFGGLHLPDVTAISRTLLEQHQAAGAPIGRAEVIYQGVDQTRFTAKAEAGHLSNPARLLYAGQVHAYKGVHTVIEALELLATRGHTATLSIAGRGELGYERELDQLTARLNLGERVKRLGMVAREALPALYREHDIFIFPSNWPEPFGLTHLEAMACGLPVVSTTLGGPGEFLLDGENALTFEADNPDSLAAALERLLCDPTKAERIARAGRAEVERFFNITRYVDDLEDWLERVRMRQTLDRMDGEKERGR